MASGSEVQRSRRNMVGDEVRVVSKGWPWIPLHHYPTSLSVHHYHVGHNKNFGFYCGYNVYSWSKGFKHGNDVIWFTFFKDDWLLCRECIGEQETKLRDQLGGYCSNAG